MEVPLPGQLHLDVADGRVAVRRQQIERIEIQRWEKSASPNKIVYVVEIWQIPKLKIRDSRIGLFCTRALRHLENIWIRLTISY